MNGVTGLPVSTGADFTRVSKWKQSAAVAAILTEKGVREQTNALR